MPDELKIAFLFSINTGFVDAYTFFRCHGRFATMQTGNLIQTGINLAEGKFATSLQFIIPVIFFFLGIMAKTAFSAWCQSRGKEDTQALVLIQLLGMTLLTIAYASGLKVPDSIFVGSFSFFMVIQGDISTKAHGFPYANIMSTGNLKSFGAAFMNLLLKREKSQLERVRVFGTLVFAFLLGAILSTFISHFCGQLALLGGSLLVLGVYIILKMEGRVRS